MQRSKGERAHEHLIGSLKADKEELESSLSKERIQCLQLKQDLTEAETRNTDLYKVTINASKVFLREYAFLLGCKSCYLGNYIMVKSALSMLLEIKNFQV